LLIGTMLGAGHAAHAGRQSDLVSAPFFADLLTWGGAEPHVRCTEPRVKARLQDGTGGTYLWIANPMRQTLPAQLTLSERWGPFSAGRTLWGAKAMVTGRTVTLDAPARDVTVIALD